VDPDLDMGSKNLNEKGNFFIVLKSWVPSAFSVGLEAFAVACTSFVRVKEKSVVVF
jgi:hypothetical protein